MPAMTTWLRRSRSCSSRLSRKGLGSSLIPYPSSLIPHPSSLSTNHQPLATRPAPKSAKLVGARGRLDGPGDLGQQFNIINLADLGQKRETERVELEFERHLNARQQAVPRLFEALLPAFLPALFESLFESLFKALFEALR